ncbi:MAG TPA: efflux RND transporter permease subunit, partial [Vicinamibacterales bacterium]|nr:efflux RND transporter permease subunit [Vicinamibacterales bacterium]
MNISEVFIRRPIATSLIMAAIALFGVLAYRALPVSDLPNIDYPTLNVSASLPGADPATMASSVASPLERQFTTIAALDSMTSSSNNGSTNITLQFDLNRDLDSAAVDVQTAIAAVMPLLPQGMPSAPSFRKYNPADQAMLLLWLNSKTVARSAIDEYAETLMAPTISMVSGVAQVGVMGAQKFAVRVQVDPEKLRAQQIGINEIDAALQDWNVNLPTGQLFAARTTFNIKASGQLMNAEAFRPLIVAYRHGAPVRLEQLARVIDSVEDDKTASWLWMRGEQRVPTIGLQIMRQPGSNTIEVTDAVKRQLPMFNSRLPPAVHLTLMRDRAV